MPERNKSEIIADQARAFEELRESISGEEQERLMNIYQGVNSLHSSMLSDLEESIKYQYGIIVTAQRENKISEVNVNNQKIYIWNEISKIYPNLLLATEGYFSHPVEKYLKEKEIDLSSLPDKLLSSAQEFLVQPLTNRALDNKFRVADWLEIVTKIKNALRPLLVYTT